MNWWTDIWLNEGFARFMENFAVDQIYPHYNIWDKFLYQAFNKALCRDSSFTHPVEIKCGNPNEVQNIG
jgi:puromycin-sensitive aminopeptidase